MTQGLEDGRKQFTSKENITVSRDIIVMNKNGSFGTKTIQEQVEFRYDPSRKAVIVNPFFRQPADPNAKPKQDKGKPKSTRQKVAKV